MPRRNGEDDACGPDPAADVSDTNDLIMNIAATMGFPFFMMLVKMMTVMMVIDEYDDDDHHHHDDDKDEGDAMLQAKAIVMRAVISLTGKASRRGGCKSVHHDCFPRKGCQSES